MSGSLQHTEAVDIVELDDAEEVVGKKRNRCGPDVVAAQKQFDKRRKSLSAMSTALSCWHAVNALPGESLAPNLESEARVAARVEDLRVETNRLEEILKATHEAQVRVLFLCQGLRMRHLTFWPGGVLLLTYPL